jgi:hypothetical protein
MQHQNPTMPGLDLNEADINSSLPLEHNSNVNYGNYGNYGDMHAPPIQSPIQSPIQPVSGE